MVLPAPAGPTTNTNRSDPATAAAASACITSSRTRVHAGGRCGRVELCVHRPADDVLLLSQHVAAGVMPGRWFDPHRPAIRTTPPRAWSRRGRGRHTPPARCRCTACNDCAHCVPSTAGCGRATSQTAWRTSKRCHAERCSATAAITSPTVTDDSTSGWFRAAALMLSVSVFAVTPTVEASASHRDRRSPTP